MSAKKRQEAIAGRDAAAIVASEYRSSNNKEFCSAHPRGLTKEGVARPALARLGVPALGPRLGYVGENKPHSLGHPGVNQERLCEEADTLERDAELKHACAT